MLRYLSCLILPFALTGTALAQDVATPAQLERFRANNPDSSRTIDFDAWSEILGDIVLRVPPSERRPALGRPIRTGTAIYRGNTTRYRFESNRVIYHLVEEDYEAAIHEFRVAMEALPSRIDFSDLNSDEQLAYWLNLYNATVIEQIAGRYPESRINRTRAMGSSQSLFEAQILNVDGVPLSLNDIQQRIVFAQWDDPRVMYGFHNGSIGGPNIRRDAFNGSTVWRQLDSNATDFINSLRGVELSDDSLRVSQLYETARPLFPDFDTDLRAHLTHYANASTSLQLEGNPPIETDVVEWHIADMTNGVIGCTGGGSPVESMGGQSPNVVNIRTMNCNLVPETGQVLLQHVFEQRLRFLRENPYGVVQTTDIDSPEDRPVINMAPSFTRNEPAPQPEG
tara:strand:+ start:8917 stop:10104 length:1188 start_codon:yes stop_codon:yes gene_type:complete